MKAFFLFLPLFTASASGQMCEDTWTFRYPVGFVLRTQSYVATCVADGVGGAFWEMSECKDEHGMLMTINEEWIGKHLATSLNINPNNRYQTWRKCIKKGEEMAIETVACVDGYGRRRHDGEQWIQNRRFVQCKILDGTGAVTDVGCVDDFGQRRLRGDEWITLSGVVKRCVMNSAGEHVSEVMKLNGCQDKTGNLRSVGDRWEENGIYVLCSVDNVVSPIFCTDTDGNRRSHGETWIQNGQEVRCGIDNGKSVIQEVRSGPLRIRPSPICIDRFGDVRAKDVEWLDGNRYVKCVSDMSGNNFPLTIACATNLGERKEDGEKWDDTDGFRYVCKINRDYLLS